ncbi:MAG: S26 family signal peptidase [Halodesulfurarchaeum sp.]
MGDGQDAPEGDDSGSPPPNEWSALDHPRSEVDRPLGGRSVDKREDTPQPDPWDGPRPALRWIRRTDHGLVVFLREILVSAIVVVLIGILLFAISGVWPPMVAVESGSMEPHLHRGDLVFVMDEHRFVPPFAVAGTGVVPANVGERHDYRNFGGYGDVIVYQPYGNEGNTPVIHRARIWIEKGENWYDDANPAFIRANSCEELAYCPAPYDGFITKGDNPRTNDYYDQVRGISNPVRPQWIRGTAEFRIPWLGWVRLAVSDTTLGNVRRLFLDSAFPPTPGLTIASPDA